MKSTLRSQKTKKQAPTTQVSYLVALSVVSLRVTKDPIILPMLQKLYGAFEMDISLGLINASQPSIFISLFDTELRHTNLTWKMELIVECLSKRIS